MKKLIFSIFIAVILLTGGVVLAQADLGPNIMRRVNSIIVELDKAEDTLNRNHMEAFQGYLKGAEKEFAKIFEYYPGKADPNHPTLSDIQKRIDALHAGTKKADEDKDKLPEDGAEK